MARRATFLAAGLTGILATACVPDLKKAPTPVSGPVALFDLEEQQKLPWPNVVAQVRTSPAGRTAIGRINLPNPTANPLIEQVNTLAGFSALPVLSFDFSAPISAATIRPGKNLLVFGVNPADAKDADDVSENLTVRFDEKFRKLRLYPQRPLRSGFRYVAVLTRSIADASGAEIVPDLTFHFLKSEQPLYDSASGRILSDILVSNGVTAAAAAQLEQVRRLYQALVFMHPLVKARVGAELAARRGVAPAELSDAAVRAHIAVATAFVTAPYEGGDPTGALDSGVSRVLGTAAAGQFFPGVTYPASTFYGLQAPTVPHVNVAYVAFGAITTLDFRSAVGLWPDPFTAVGAVTTVTFIATYPKAVTVAQVPAVIFQHGLGSCKNESVLAVADSFAQAGFAVVGIDVIEFGDRARTNVDPRNDGSDPETCDQIVDGKLVSTGEAFVRVDDLRITRDAMRQSAVDLAALAKAAQGGAFRAVRAGGDFIPGSATFAGTGLGSILGTLFLAEQNIVNVGALNVGAAWLSRLFLESATFGPVLAETIAAQAGVGAVTSEAFQDYVTKLGPLLQGLVDPADPAYYVVSDSNGKPLSQSKAILVQEVIGDPVIPNASTEFLARLAGLPLVTTATPAAERAGPFPFSAWTQFPGASHGVLLTPDDPATAAEDADLLAITAAVRTQMLTYLGSFLQSGGTALQVLVTE